jgi:hypothetical protein
VMWTVILDYPWEIILANQSTALYFVRFDILQRKSDKFAHRTSKINRSRLTVCSK